MDEEWTVVESKRNRKTRKGGKKASTGRRSLRASRDDGDIAKHECGDERALLNASIGEMNEDLLPEHRAEMSSRPTGSRKGVHAATTGNTIRPVEFGSVYDYGPDRIDRVAADRSILIDEKGIPADGWMQYEGNRVNLLVSVPSVSVNKKKRWELAEKDSKDNQIYTVQRRRYGWYGGYQEPVFARPVSEMAPRARMEAPTVVRGRKGAEVRERRLPGKQVASRDRNKEKFPRWAQGEGVRYTVEEEERQYTTRTPGVGESVERLPPNLTLVNQEEIESDIYRYHVADDNRIPRGRRQSIKKYKDKHDRLKVTRRRREDRDWKSQLS